MLSQVLQRLRQWWSPPARNPYAGLQAGPWPRQPQNDAEAYGVKIRPADVLPGDWYWQAASIHHLTPAENGGNHHIYLDLVHPSMGAGGQWTLQRVPLGRLLVTWDGGRQVLTLDRPAGGPGASLAMWRDQVCRVSALGQPGAELPSDCVMGIHTGHPDEAAGNRRFHHSFRITFQKVQSPPMPDVVPDGRLLAHYVLFGPAEQPATLANLWLAQEYLLACRPAFGFNPDEAASATLVTIIADSEAVSPAIAERLRAGGAQVYRIAGPAGDVAHALAERVARGER